jgi:hypothetical protein
MSSFDEHSLDRDLHRKTCIHNSGEQGLGDSMEECRIVLMDDNRLAIAPCAAYSGDFICLLQCAQAVCVLRPHENCYWKLISGDCHVFGGDEFLDRGDHFGAPIFPYRSYCEEKEERMEVFTIC